MYVFYSTVQRGIVLNTSAKSIL